MAITATTAPGVDRIYRADRLASLIESGLPFASTATNFNQGDLCYLDTSNHIINVVSSTAHSLTFLGIAPCGVTKGILQGPYDGLSSASQAIQDFQGPVYAVVGSMKAVSGDALHPGDKMYLANGQDAATLTVTDPGDANYVGIYVGPTIASATAGQSIQVKIGCRYPAATGGLLQF
jgi:hypothetical protein